MNVLKKSEVIFILLFIVILFACVLSVIFNEDASISVNSIPAIAVGVSSSVFAVIAFENKEVTNLFLTGGRRWRIFIFRSIYGNKFEPDIDNDEYRMYFAISAFIYCAVIPLYIPIAFFAKDFGISFCLTLSVMILRMLSSNIFVTFFRIIIVAKEQKHERIKDEAARKEQEHRESIGKWK